jgi:hypothetical protein
MDRGGGERRGWEENQRKNENDANLRHTEATS